jgi:PAS domain S-box-containing protein
MVPLGGALAATLVLVLVRNHYFATVPRPWLVALLAVVILAASFGDRWAGSSALLAASAGAFSISFDSHAADPLRAFATTPFVLFVLCGVTSIVIVEWLRLTKRRADQNDALLRTALEGYSDGVITTDEAGRVTRINPAAEAMIGVALEDAIGRPIDGLVKLRILPSRLESPTLAGRVLDENVGVERKRVELASPQGGDMPVDEVALPIRGRDGAIGGCVVILKDARPRGGLVAEENRDERFRMLAESIPHLAWMADADGNVTWFNRRWYDYTGTTFEEMKGWGWQAVHDPEELPRVLAAWKASIASGEPFDMVFPLRGIGGEFRAFLTRVVPIRGDLGTITHWFGTNTDISEQKRAEERLRRLGQSSREILDSITDAFYALDRQWRFTYLNSKAEELLEHGRGQLLGKPLFEAFPGVAGTEFDDALKRAARERRTQSVTAFFAEHVRWYETRIYPGPNGVAVYFKDVSERKRGEAEIERLRLATETQRRVYETALSHTADFNYLFDTDGRIRFANQSLLALSGKPLAEVVGRRLDEIGIPTSLRERLEACIQTVVTHRRSITEVAPFAIDGVERRHEVVLVPVLGAGGAVEAVAGSSRDLTDRLQTEEALRESHRLYRAVGESIDYGVWICDAAGRNVYCSDSFLRLVGMTQEECSEYGWFDTLHPEDLDETLAAWHECVENGCGWDREYRVRGKDGRWHPVLARGVPVRDDRGEITSWAGINLDIGRLKQVENDLREADRRKDEFLATLAHELRNPLAPIANLLEIMKRSNDDPAVTHDARITMERQIRHLVRLIDDLMDLSRINRNQLELRLEEVDLARVLADAVEVSRPHCEASEHRLVTSVPATPIRLRADPTRLAQIFGNLLNNACKYTPPGGKIELEVECANEEALIRVRDDGIGIPRAMLERVFDIFSQVDRAQEGAEGGLGIGLSLVKWFVEMHGGTVTAHSDGIGRGSEFRVRLPVLPEEREAAPTPSEDGARIDVETLPKRRVLVVDDNRDSARSLAMLIELAGSETATAFDGIEAVRLTKTFRPDLILLDIGLPKLNGYETCRAIRDEPGGNDVEIVALTGWGQDADRKRSKQAGFDGHLVKPLDPAEIPRLLVSRARG